MGFAARLYPKDWRERYGAEFDALLDDAKPRWRDLADVLRGAFIMQMTSWKSYGKIAAATAFAGAVLALGASFLVANRYESRAVLHVGVPDSSSAGTEPGALERMVNLQRLVLGRRSLTFLILDPRLDLYKEERRHLTTDEVAEQMRTRDIRVRLYDAPLGKPAAGQAFVVSFSYPDRYKAQQVLRDLVGKMEETNFILSRKGSSEAVKLDLLDAPTYPAGPTFPNRGGFLFMGLASGLGLGLLGALSLRHPKQTLTVGLSVLAGFAVAWTIAYLIPAEYESRAVMRIMPTQGSTSLSEIAEAALSADSLGRLIQDPQLALYQKQRRHKPLAEVAELMRTEHVRFTVYPMHPGERAQAFTVGFTYPDRFKAQSVVRALTGRFQEGAFDHKTSMELLDPADLPQYPIYPNRSAIAALGGAIAGLIAGAVIVVWRRPSHPQITPAPAAA
jgi:hypothetical protein